LRKDKINVALLWSKYSGNVTSVNDLVLGLDRERFNIIFIYLSGHGVDKNLIEEAGYQVFYLSRIKRLKIFRFSILRRLVKILKEHNVDILHCHAHKATVYGTISAMLAKTPVVIAHVHGLGRSHNFKRKLMNFLLFRKINRIIPVAESVKKDVLKNNWFLSENKFFVLENSVDYERFAVVSIPKKDARQMLEVPSDAFVFGTVGRLAPTKGLSYMIEAFAKVKQQMPSSHLVLLGDGRCKAELQNQAVSTSYQDSIHFLGRRENIPQLLKGIDVFVLASIAEGLPRVILEAMAAGVPCIATQVGGIPEIINTENVGIWVPPANADALAEAMLKVANMPRDRLEKLTESAQNRVRQVYSHDVVGEKLRKLYESEFALHCQDRDRSAMCQR
jgi:glycosyltransferase involved in cell wall biosynthesis